MTPKAVAARPVSFRRGRARNAANILSRSQTVQLRRRPAYFSKSGAEQCLPGARTIIAGDVIACQVKRDAQGPRTTLHFAERRTPRRIRCSRTIVVPEALPGNCMPPAASKLHCKLYMISVYTYTAKGPARKQCLVYAAEINESRRLLLQVQSVF